MRTALAILSEKKEKVMLGYADEAKADMAWLNFLEGQMLMATVNALCLLDPLTTDPKERLACAVGREAALLISLGEPVTPAMMKVEDA